MKVILSSLLVVLLAGCNGFVGEMHVEKPAGPAIKIVDPDYVILRPLSDSRVAGGMSASTGQRAYYFDPAARILDLRQLDPRTAQIQSGAQNTPIISIRTTDEGSTLLGSWTSANLGKQLGVFVGDRLISAPTIQSKITGMIVIDGDFTNAEAEEVLARLRRGGAAV